MREWTRAQAAAGVIGLLFLGVGILGFIPGITTDYDDLGFANHDGARLVGLFGVNVLHNVAHIVLGVAGLAAATSHSRARAYLLVGGALYLALAVFGLVIDRGEDVNSLALNTADNWLHLGLAALMLAVGAATASRPDLSGQAGAARR